MIAEIATFCVFNRTRESFLCLRAAVAQKTPEPKFMETDGAVFSNPSHGDGIWLMRSPGVDAEGIYTVGRAYPVDRIYLDQRNRVVQLIEYLNPLQIVPVHCRYSSVVETRVHTIYASRTRVGDELLICFPEEVKTQWEELQGRAAWTQQEVVQCSKG